MDVTERAARLAQEEAEPLQAMREKAAKTFAVAEMPPLTYGLGISTHLDFSLEELPADRTGGEMNIEAEHAEVYVPEEQMLWEHIGTAIPPKDKLRAFHYALLTQGRCIHVPANTEAHVNISTTHTNALSSTHLLVLAEENAHLTITENIDAAEKGAEVVRVATHAVEAFASEGATIRYASLQDMAEDVYYFPFRTSIHGKDAAVNWVDCHTGGKLVKSDVTARLRGEGASTRNYTAYLGSGRQHYDIYNASKHEAPHTTSDTKAIGVQKGRSKSIARGLINIGENAPHVHGDQEASALLLSEHAISKSMPILEINNNEVETEHAATTSHIDPEDRFYLSSRGIPPAKAEQLIAEGFFHPIVKHLPAQAREIVEKRIREGLE